MCLNYVFIKNFNWNKFLLGMFFNKFQWAKIVLVVEQSVSTEIRKEERLTYSHPSADGDRNFVVRWHQTVRNQWPCVHETMFLHEYHSVLGRPYKTLFKGFSLQFIILWECQFIDGQVSSYLSTCMNTVCQISLHDLNNLVVHVSGINVYEFYNLPWNAILH